MVIQKVGILEAMQKGMEVGIKEGKEQLNHMEEKGAKELWQKLKMESNLKEEMEKVILDILYIVEMEEAKDI